MTEPDSAPDPVEIPITDILDLHTFSPRDLGILLPEYIRCCQEKGILRVRIVHGKGTGTLRTTVHAMLAKLPAVLQFDLADESSGGWGATWVTLRSDARSHPNS